LKNPILRIGTDYYVHFDISSPHNSLLQIMCENGIVGIVLMFPSGTFIIFKSIRKNSIDKTLKLIIFLLFLNMLYDTIFNSLPMLILFVSLIEIFRNQAEPKIIK
jgi:O-antigen ligase